MSLAVKAGQYRTPLERETGHPFTDSGNYEFDPAGFELLRRAIERVGGDAAGAADAADDGGAGEGEGGEGESVDGVGRVGGEGGEAG